jgi:SagB-type dehydrogenase family enzyme
VATRRKPIKNFMTHSQIVLNYHNRTKHTLERYAKGPETLDWDDQPDPFRHFSGVEVTTLPKPGRDLALLYTDLDKPATITPLPLDMPNLALLLELAFGLSAWKEFGPNRWALRCNPSSGNLHPTEAYLISTGQAFLASGVYHYVSYDHSLEQRCVFGDNASSPGLFIGLSSVHWREAWKYGERAFRYCQHDVGHALGALRYAAACLGWTVELLIQTADSELGQILGLDRQGDFKPHEEEFPDVLCRIIPAANATPVLVEDLLMLAQSASWFGTADSLRAYHLYHWPVIEEVSQAADKSRIEQPKRDFSLQAPLPSSCTQKATAIIRQRRSAQQFNGKMPLLPAADFFRMLSAVMPNTAAFELWPCQAKVHLFIFVHLVEGLAPGLYVLLRDDAAMEALKASASDTFDWEKASDELPFYHLYSGDFKQMAKTLSCHQPIASDSAFSLAMVAEFKETVATASWQYRQLFWECGLIGQVLYLEAEAAGIRGTGIGCYFDDSVHDVLGIKDDTFQSLYHFTIGSPLEDKRLQTFPAYDHLADAAANEPA